MLAQSVHDFDGLLKSLKEPPIFINDLLNTTKEDRQYIEEIITSRYSSDMVTTLPSCKCGITKLEANKHTICDFCGTKVESSMADEIIPSVWFRKPAKIEKIMNPLTWIMLRNRFKKSGFDIIRWLTDTRYIAQVKEPPVLSKLIAAGIKQGYNNFVRNFDAIMDFLFGLSDFKIRRGEDYLQRYIKEYRHLIFSDHMPIVNRSVLVVEDTDFDIYVDKTVLKGIEAIQTLVGVDKDTFEQQPQVRENKIARGLAAYSEYLASYYRLIMSSKPGMLRKHLGGTRIDFAGRAVITSNTGRNKYDDIQIPWGMMVTLFRPRIVAKLITDHKFTLNNSIGHIKSHVYKYCPILNSIMEDILKGCRNERYPVIFNRFPSLLQGSLQLVNINDFKRDPMDMTISMSTLILRSFNADRKQIGPLT